jgi:hypothetical protein
MEWDDLFVLRHWDRRDGPRVEIGRHEPVPDEVRRLVEASVPVPRDGALLGWVSGYQVQAVLAAHGRLPEPWDDASAVPGVLVMPLVTRHPGCVFLVPGGDGAAGHRHRRAGAHVVVTERLSTEEFWLPAGVYADHWTLREGMPVMTARQLLALPGVVDLVRPPDGPPGLITAQRGSCDVVQ